jgi:hypothetical protein
MFAKYLAVPLLLLSAGSASSAQESHSLNQLEGTARVLMVFAPDANSTNFKRQLSLIEHHSFELSARNTVVVPVGPSGMDLFGGEMLPLSSTSEQTYARTRYHVNLSDFAVVLLNEDGAEAMRSTQPVDIHLLVAMLDAMPQR